MNRATAGNRRSGRILVILAVVLSAGITALAGCGLGPGEEQGRAALLVTRDYGREVLAENDAVALTRSSTALKLLDGTTDLETAYGGGFVQAVNGLSGTSSGGRSRDWFYSVNGVVAERGSADYRPVAGDSVWWDYRDWTDAMLVGAQVGAYPAPFDTGYDGRRWTTRVVCLDSPAACRKVKGRLRADGARTGPADAGDADSGPDPSIRVLVGTGKRLAGLPEGSRLQAGPAESGVFARFQGDDLLALDVRGQPAVNLGADAGLVAAMRQGQDPPVWIVAGGNETGVERAATILNRTDLARRYAAVAVSGKVGSLPWEGSR